MASKYASYKHKRHKSDRVPDNQYNGISSSAGQPPQHNSDTINSSQVAGEIKVLCGPLINYQHMSYAGTSTTWNGSVLIVTKPTELTPRLHYGPAESRGESITADGLKLYQDPDKAFWRFSLEVPLSDAETRWTYAIPNITFLSDVHKDEGRRFFFVPGADQSMRIMFHSCNGFSVGTDEDFWSGKHAKRGTWSGSD